MRPLTANQMTKVSQNFGKNKRDKNNALFASWKKDNNWNNQSIAWRQQALKDKPWRVD